MEYSGRGMLTRQQRDAGEPYDSLQYDASGNMVAADRRARHARVSASTPATTASRPTPPSAALVSTPSSTCRAEYGWWKPRRRVPQRAFRDLRRRLGADHRLRVVLLSLRPPPSSVSSTTPRWAAGGTPTASWRSRARTGPGSTSTGPMSPRLEAPAGRGTSFAEPGSTFHWSASTAQWERQPRDCSSSRTDRAGSTWWPTDSGLHDNLLDELGYRGWQWAGGTGSAQSFDAARMATTQVNPISFFRNRAYDKNTGGTPRRTRSELRVD